MKIKTRTTDLNENELVHWTSEEGLEGILRDQETIESTSLTDTLSLPFDVENDCPYGIIFNRQQVEELGYKKLEPGTDGCTAQELLHEWTYGKEIPTSAVEGFICRKQRDAEWLQDYLQEEWGLDERVEVTTIEPQSSLTDMMKVMEVK